MFFVELTGFSSDSWNRIVNRHPSPTLYKGWGFRPMRDVGIALNCPAGWNSFLRSPRLLKEKEESSYRRNQNQFLIEKERSLPVPPNSRLIQKNTPNGLYFHALKGLFGKTRPSNSPERISWNKPPVSISLPEIGSLVRFKRRELFPLFLNEQLMSPTGLKLRTSLGNGLGIIINGSFKSSYID